jgi:hypothetical protein
MAEAENRFLTRTDGSANPRLIISFGRRWKKYKISAREMLLNPLGPNEGRTKMLYTLAVLLVVMWLLGMLTSYTVGGLIHLLLAVAIIAVLIRIIQGRSAPLDLD